MPPITPPANYTYGTITFRGAKQIADTADDADRYPDLIPSAGTVTFTPNVTYFKNLAMPVTFVTEPIVGTLDANGDMRDSQGQLGVVLVSSDNPDISPRNWTYSVVMTVGGRTLPSFNISVEGGTTKDLTTLMPAAISAGTVVITSEQARIEAEAARDEAVAAAETATADIDDAIAAYFAVNPVEAGADDADIAALISGTSATRTSLDTVVAAAVNAVKSKTEAIILKNEGTGVWPPRQSGFVRNVFYGSDPGPADIQPQDLRQRVVLP
jgi:hypothetical protein